MARSIEHFIDVILTSILNGIELLIAIAIVFMIIQFLIKWE